MSNHEFLEPVAPDDNSVETVPLSNEQLESILKIQQVVLDSIAEDKRESEILDQLCRLAEGLLENCVASVLLLHQNNQLLSVVSAPNIPEEGQIRLSNLRPDVGYGSCTAAVFHGEPAYVKNAFNDHRTAKAIDMIKDYNICTCWSVPVYDREKNVTGCFMISSFEHRSPTTYHDRLMKTCSSIVSIMQERKALRRLSMTDKLTGLWNRVKLDKLLVTQAATYYRHAETYCVMLLDVDHFKSVNDTHGHNVGDAVLIELANILQTSVRTNDIVGRWGGEEFMVLLSKSDAAKAEIVAEKIRNSIMHHDFPVVGNITVSIGICEVSQQVSILQMIDRADQALYKAKENGRNQVCVFVPAKPDKRMPARKVVSA
jgi:diguanylate cyclase (GGDEF)-like protein